MKNLTKLIIAIALIAGIVAIAGNCFAWSISGTVYERDGVIGLSEADITLHYLKDKVYTQATTSDTNGNYSFTGLENGSYVLEISKLGCVFNLLEQPIIIQDSDKIIDIKRVEPITIIDNGQGYSTVVIGENATIVEQFAAEELVKYLQKITGVTLAIKKDNESILGNKILIGEPALNSYVANYGINLTQEELGLDGFIIKTTPEQNLILAGRSHRGSLYAVYDFLEMLGCRWFMLELYPTDEVVPQNTKIQIPPLDVKEKPTFDHRAVTWDELTGNVNFKATIDWTAKNKINVFRISGADLVKLGVLEDVRKRDLIINNPSHAGGYKYLPWDKPIDYWENYPNPTSTVTYFEAHPEWFGLRDGVRVPNQDTDEYGKAVNFDYDNLEGVEEFSKNVLLEYYQRPYLDIVGAFPVDSRPFSENITDKTASFIRLHNAIVEKFAQNNISIKAESEIYQYTVDLPQEPVALSPGRCLLFAAHKTLYSDWSLIWKEHLQSWLGMYPPDKNEIIMFTYYNAYSQNGSVPTLLIDAIINEANEFKTLGMYGVDNGWWEAPWRSHSFNAYIYMRSLWNKQINPDQMIYDFTREYFKQAHKPMYEMFQHYRQLELPTYAHGYMVLPYSPYYNYIEMSEQLWVERGFPGFIENLKGLKPYLEEAKIKAAEDPVISKRVADTADAVYGPITGYAQMWELFHNGYILETSKGMIDEEVRQIYQSAIAIGEQLIEDYKNYATIYPREPWFRVQPTVIGTINYYKNKLASPQLPGDFDGDNDVDIQDLILVAKDYGVKYDLQDLLLVAMHYGEKI